MIGGLLAAALAAGAAVMLVASQTKVDREVYLMGTRGRLEAYAATREAGLRLLDHALTVLEDTEDQLSTWRADSAITAFNRHPVGHPWAAPGDLCATFGELFRLSRLSGHTFDPAIGALTDAWAIHDSGRIPTAAERRAAMLVSGMRLLRFDQDACVLTRLGDVRLDVGAWGKGDALDRVRRALPDVPWLIDLGGQVAVNDGPEQGWRVALAHPRDRGRAFLAVQLRSGSLSTSGGSERDVEVQGRRIAHLLDPRTGEPAAFAGSVSVWHQSALVADALSTALYVMGPQEGMRWAEQHHVAVLFLIPRGDEVISEMTDGFRALGPQQ